MSNETAKYSGAPRVTPATDVVEREDGYHLFLDLPGVAKDALAIDLDGNELTVSATAAFPDGSQADNAAKGDDAGESFTHREFLAATYRRSFTLSDVVDRQKIAAKMENGVLHLTLPKSENAIPRKVEITQG